MIKKCAGGGLKSADCSPANWGDQKQELSVTGSLASMRQMLVSGNLEPTSVWKTPPPLAVRKGSAAKSVRDLDSWDKTKTKQLWTAPDR